jgi:predicted O-methyltransferase YrrM
MGPFADLQRMLQSLIRLTETLSPGEQAEMDRSHNELIGSLGQSLLFRFGNTKNAWTFRRPRITVLSLTVGEEYGETVRLGLQSRIDYCQRWGYRWINQTESLDSSRPIAWSKVRAILGSIDDCDYLVWLDADTVIMNPTLPIELFLLRLPPDRSVMIGSDFNGLNTGVMFLRSCSAVKDFFAEIDQNRCFSDHIWWEQRAVFALFPRFRSIVEVIEHQYSHLFNAYSPVFSKEAPFRVGDWCFHMAGIRTPTVVKALMEQMDEFRSARRSLFERFPVDLTRMLMGRLEGVQTEVEVISDRSYYFEVFPRLREHLKKIQHLCQQSGSLLEGSSFTRHETDGQLLPELINKQRNLYSLARGVGQILEIGFNAGHSALLFLLANPSTQVTAIDLGAHPYVDLCRDYLTGVFPGRLTLLKGDSRELLARQTEVGRYDLIHVDGGHQREVVESDVSHAVRLLPTYLVLDDTQDPVIQEIGDLLLDQLLATECQMAPTYLYQHLVLKIDREVASQRSIQF